MRGLTSLLRPVAGALACALLILPSTLFAAPPDWWIERGVLKLDSATGLPVEADDLAVANIGQLKHIAAKAYAELNEQIPGGAGPVLDALILPWYEEDTTETRDDSIVVTLGQLKYVGKRFYDRLIAIGYTSGYPWAGTPDDKALANLGQLKKVFNFDVAFDGDQPPNDLPDWWEIKHFGTSGGASSRDFDDDGLTDSEEFTANTDPLEKAPILTVTSPVGAMLVP